MAGRRPKGQVAVIPSRSMVASAVRYPGKAARIYRPTQGWQKDAYRHYGICGEARMAATFFGQALSRTKLGIGRRTAAGVEPVTSGPAFNILNELFAGKDGQAQMLEALGIHLTIAGEAFLVGRQVDGMDQWEIVSVLEMVVNGNGWSIRYGEGMADVPLSDSDVVIRIWRPDPANRIEADSPFKSLLPILTEIEWLTKRIFAEASSRLTGAGVWFLPDSIDLPDPPEQEGVNVSELSPASKFQMLLGEQILTPLGDQSSPAAVSPMIAMIPPEDLEKVNPPITFWSPLDEHAKELRDEAIRRFAVGMSLPPEQILGMGSNGGTGGGSSNGVSHWGAWQIEEATIKMFVEPALETIVNALTVGYLRPLQKAQTDEEVTYDTTSLKLRPDRSKEALELHALGLISDETVVRENGFLPSDVMSPEEMQLWLLRKIASGSATPEQVAWALSKFGLTDVPTEGDVSDARESRPTPSLEEHPDRPRTPEASADPVLVAACYPLLLTALQKSGNKIIRANSKVEFTCPAHLTYTVVSVNGTADEVLDKAFLNAADSLEGIGDAERIVPVLDAHCRDLFQSQEAPSRERLGEALVKAGI